MCRCGRPIGGMQLYPTCGLPQFVTKPANKLGGERIASSYVIIPPLEQPATKTRDGSTRRFWAESNERVRETTKPTSSAHVHQPHGAHVSQVFEQR